MAENTPIISFRDSDILNGEATVIYGLNMDVYPGDFVYIVGKVGTGKTSIIRTIIAENDLENTKTQLETAKTELEKPFSKEDELKQKTARLAELNALLDVDKRDNEIVGGEPDEGDNLPDKNRTKDKER